MMGVSKHRFKRQESWRLKRVKESWRRPRGVTSRMRKEKNGWPPKVKVGYGTAASTRGLHPRGLIERLVRNESDLEGLKPKTHIARLSRQLGEKRRLILLERIRSLNIHVANPGKEEARPVGEEAAPADLTTSSMPSTEEAPVANDEEDASRLEHEETAQGSEDGKHEADSEGAEQ